MDLSALAPTLLVGAAIVLLAVLGVRFAGKLGVSGLLLYLLIGLIGGTFFPALKFDQPELATVLGYSALVIILAQGGLTTRMSKLQPVLAPSIVLASVGVIVSIAVVAIPLVLLGVELRTALLLGTVLAATDAAAVFSVLRKLRVNDRLRTVLEAEAGFNDAPVAVIVSVIVSPAFSEGPLWQIPLLIVLELVVGAAIGVAMGYFARWALPRLALPAVGLYPIAALAFLVLAFGAADIVHVSGFMAVYLAAVIIGSSDEIPHRRSIIGFADALAWIAEIGLFIMLGLLATLSELPSALWLAGLALVFLVFLGRPLAALVSLLPFRFPMRDIAFVGGAGLRGAVPIVFAAIPLGVAIPGASVVFNATMVVVIILLLVQTPVLPWLGRVLKVESSDSADELEVESAPLDGMKAIVLGIDVPTTSHLVGTFVVELGLPKGAVVSLVIRDGEAIAPDANTRIRAGDRLVVVTTAAARKEAEARIRTIAQHGRLADWKLD